MTRPSQKAVLGKEKQLLSTKDIWFHVTLTYVTKIKYLQNDAEG
jgi:hypothetical protein